MSEILRPVSKSSYGIKNVVLPIGISFFTFKEISFLIDIYKGNVRVIRIRQAVLYFSFFAQIQAGPLSRYHDMEGVHIESRNPKQLYHNLSEGFYRFVVGFNKKILLADILSNITSEIFSKPIASVSTALAWLGAVCYSLQLLYDFEGYSDMAIGISRMFGYDCPENFIYPYLTGSVSEFWRRWHVTLGNWFRDYVYIPLGGSRKGNRRLYFNLLVVWLLTGIWHGSSWNFIWWGIAYFFAIAFEKVSGWPKRLKSKCGKYVYRIYTLLFINLQWVIFRSDNLRNGLQYIQLMFIPSRCSLADFRMISLIKDYWVFLIAAISFCFPLYSWIQKKCRWKRLLTIVECIDPFFIGFLFIAAISFVISGQNHPFVYADF